jgi:hypothetical protein
LGEQVATTKYRQVLRVFQVKSLGKLSCKKEKAHVEQWMIQNLEPVSHDVIDDEKAMKKR